MVRAAAALCEAQARRGHAVTVATALLAPGPPREETSAGVRVHRFPSPALLTRFLVPAARGLRSFLSRELGSFDIVHVHGHRHGLAWVTARVLGRARRPFILQPAG